MIRPSTVPLGFFTLLICTPLIFAEYTPPKFAGVRYAEDYSGLAGQDRSGLEAMDRIKFIPISADESVWLSIGGQVRYRTETFENFGFGEANDDTYHLYRLRLHGDLHVSENIRVFAEAKSSLASDRSLPGGRRSIDLDEFDLQNGFVDIKLPIGDWGTFTFRPGRQELMMGNQRLVTPFDWANTRRTFDGFSGILDIEGWKIHSFWARLVTVDRYDFNEANDAIQLYGIYGKGKIPGSDTGWDLYWLGLGRDSKTFNGTTGEEDRQTIGTRVWGKSENGADYELEVAYQFGEVGTGDINAYMIAAEAGYTFKDAYATPRLWCGFDYATGDSSAGGDVETFDHLFPLAHKYLGYVDIVGRFNTIDISPAVNFKIKKLWGKLQHHFFWRADTDDALYNVGGAVLRTGSSGTASEVGQEFDLLLKYPVNRRCLAVVGYSHFFAGDFIEQSGSSKDIDFFFLQLQYTF